MWFEYRYAAIGMPLRLVLSAEMKNREKMLPNLSQ
jgi:hypothetical protein